ncbi:hypothetical protein [Cellulomonas denverensis]|uniref:Lipoprotein n=1 Tax=Cellulomonas denverensis TaxID=264297 RepID=A0A7X6QZ95_9CELL|nr:hypothetical protein [Cellulomonas denverensis]NKY22930.1 hypothetical protein [Cellulomonas denverensis]
MRKLIAAGVATVVAIALMTGCTGAEQMPAVAPSMLPPSAPLTVDGMDLEPQVDEASGAVVLPMDHFQPTWEENDVLATASSVDLALCARDRGVTFLAAGLAFDAIYLSESYYGPWTVAQAERFAFVPPMTDADLAANSVTGTPAASSPAGDPGPDPNLDLTDEDWATIDECGASEAGATFREATQLNGPWTEQLDAAEAALLTSDEAVDLFDELGACFTSRGMEPSPDAPWTVVGAVVDEISEQQVQLASSVVACKEETGFTERMARLEARATIPVITEFAGELADRREQIDAAVADARALIAANGDVMRPDS